MRRFLFILGTIFCLAQSAGLADALAPEPCQQACPNDDTDGQCAPMCTDCVCCPHQQPVLLACRIVPAPSPPIELAEIRAAIGSPSARSNEILHIPEALLA